MTCGATECDEAGLERIAAVLLAGGTAIIPTDTVYGLAAHPGFPGAVERLYLIKGRDRSKPIAMLASDAAAVERAGFPLAGRAGELARRFWPGALTIVCESAAGGLFEGFRVPAHEWTRRLVARCGGLLRTTSANISGRPAPASAAEAISQLGTLADVAADGGTCAGGTASAVVRVRRTGELETLRGGADPSIAAALAEKVL